MAMKVLRPAMSVSWSAVAESHALATWKSRPTTGRCAAVAASWPWSEVIDVRSPREFAIDHVPGAINLPVLSDSEHHEVGKLYAADKFAARKRGAALICQNISNTLQGHFADRPKDYAPLVYCWRGGLRSGSFAHILGSIGFGCGVLDGGYKAYRAHVHQSLKNGNIVSKLRLQTIRGATGSGKTLALQGLREKGCAVLDLEGLACHKGSLLGQYDGVPQPSQKAFDGVLLRELIRLEAVSSEHGRRVWVESESGKVGDVFLPSPLLHALRSAETIDVNMTLKSRVDFILSDYEHLVRDKSKTKALLAKLSRRVNSEWVKSWNEFVDNDDWPALVENLLSLHYDPCYDYESTENGGGQRNGPARRIEASRTYTMDPLVHHTVEDAIGAIVDAEASLDRKDAQKQTS